MAPGKVIHAALGWRDNLDWGPQDVLELTLGEPGPPTCLDHTSLKAMGMQGVSKIWKVGPSLPLPWPCAHDTPQERGTPHAEVDSVLLPQALINRLAVALLEAGADPGSSAETEVRIAPRVMLLEPHLLGPSTLTLQAEGCRLAGCCCQHACHARQK